MRIAIAIAIVLAQVGPAAAFSDPDRYAAPSTEGGGGGRHFTGSRADGFSCSVCHRGGEAPDVTFEGLPEQLTPGTRYPVVVRWRPIDVSYAIQLEISGPDGRHAQLEIPALDDLPASARCDGEIDGAPAVYAIDLGDRRVVGVQDCGATELAFAFTAPDGVVELAAGIVRSDSSADPEGDGVLEVRRRFGDDANAGGCSSAPDAGGALAWLALLMLLARRRWALALALPIGLACAGSDGPGATEASTGLYVRADTDDTTVVSPHVRVRGRATEALTVETAYTVDAWTGASVDVTTAATEAITEVRHELETGAGYRVGDTDLRAGYRYSHEPDYDSHGATLGTSIDLARKNTTLAVDVQGSIERVGRAGDPGFGEPAYGTGGRLRLVQIVDVATLAELSLDTSRAGGYLASPYRWVAVGGDGTCAGGAAFCVPELVPDTRYRHAATARARRALGERLSVGGHYRLYRDSWGLWSHTAGPSLSMLPGEGHQLDLHYRYYTQGEADFYRARYTDFAATNGYLTRDRKLSAFYSHEAGLSYTRSLALGADHGYRLRLGARASVSRIRYLDFVGLTRVLALESTGFLAIEVDP